MFLRRRQLPFAVLLAFALGGCGIPAGPGLAGQALQPGPVDPVQAALAMGQQMGEPLGEVSMTYWNTEHAGPADEIDAQAAMTAFVQWMGPEVSRVATDGGWTVYDGTVTAPTAALLAMEYQGMDGEAVVPGAAQTKGLGAEYIPIMVDPLSGKGYLGFFDAAGTHLFGPVVPAQDARVQGPLTDAQLQAAADALTQGLGG